MRAAAKITTPTDDISVAITITGSLHDFKKLREAMAESLPHWQIMALLEAIDDAAARIERKVVGAPIVVVRRMVEADL